MQMGFYFDQTRCVACLACITSCKQWHHVPPGSAKWRRVITTESGKYPNVAVNFLSTGCYHCAEPVCVDVCPAKAISKREQDGIVLVNSEKCREPNPCGIIFEEGLADFT